MKCKVRRCPIDFLFGSKPGETPCGCQGPETRSLGVPKKWWIYARQSYVSLRCPFSAPRRTLSPLLARFRVPQVSVHTNDQVSSKTQAKTFGLSFGLGSQPELFCPLCLGCLMNCLRLRRSLAPLARCSFRLRLARTIRAMGSTFWLTRFGSPQTDGLGSSTTRSRISP